MNRSAIHDQHYYCIPASGGAEDAGLILERRDANRIYYSLIEERLAICVGQFLSTVCPEQIVLRQQRKKRSRTVSMDRKGPEVITNTIACRSRGGSSITTDRFRST